MNRSLIARRLSLLIGVACVISATLLAQARADEPRRSKRGSNNPIPNIPAPKNSGQDQENQENLKGAAKPAKDGIPGLPSGIPGFPGFPGANRGTGNRNGASGNMPFDFNKMMNGFFGEETEAERRALEKIAVPIEEERKVGTAAANQFIAELRKEGIDVRENGEDADYLKRLVALLQPQMKNGSRYKQIRVFVADSPKTDARSFPGGTLVFFRGILDFAQCEAALVGVVGHELSHLDHGHQLNPIRRMRQAQKQFSGGANNFEQFMQGGMSLARGFAKPFRPEEEAEADQDGVTWMYQSGYDPRPLAELFLRMHNRDANKVTLEFMRTHPAPVDRHRKVLERFEKLAGRKSNENLYVGTVNLERRITRDQERFEE